MMPKITLVFFSALFLFYKTGNAQTELIGNIQGRNAISLDGKWQYIVDPYETGFYDYRYKERREQDPDAYWNSDVPKNKSDRKEHGYVERYSLKVPGDWNSQDAKFLYYEGTVWYKKSFNYKKTNTSSRVFLYFGAVNYRADVYLNGRKLGMHKGGFTPFNFEVPDSILKTSGNYLVVKVDNKRAADEIPTLNTDWWNYGGITRSVKLVEVPRQFIANYVVRLDRSGDRIEGSVKLDGPSQNNSVTLEIPELRIKQSFPVNSNEAKIDVAATGLEKWSPEHPKLYRVILSTSTDQTEDKIGFRTIAVDGDKVLLNGKQVFMRGISIHGEVPLEGRRAYSKQDALLLLGWAKELNCNMVRLAHYPHDENMTRVADSLGIMVWSEIPVYWTIDFTNQAVLQKAKQQLNEMISRDQDRASVIIWSVGNETPVSTARTEFMSTLLETARQLDPSRLVSAALEVKYDSQKNLRLVDDPLGKYVDLVAFNEYLGWYGGTPLSCRTANWATVYKKPLFISETGAEALGGFHGDSTTVWTEDYQAWYYREQVAMLQRMPSNFTGISPWILADFRSPRRNNPQYQDGWNNKGLIDHKGRKKKAFYVLQAYYAEIKNRQQHNAK